MRNAILEKLNKELFSSVETEAQVVYIFVEVRKIIKDHDNQQANYATLYFFCDWVVHAKMDRKGAKNLLNAIQNFYKGLDEYLHIKKRTSFLPFVMLMQLRRELRLFLKQNEISTKITDIEDQWINFLFILVDVVIDCPLVSSTGDIREFRFIESEDNNKIKCELVPEKGKPQQFVAKNKYEYLEEDFSSFIKMLDKI